MDRLVHQIASMFALVSVMTSGAAIAQQAATLAAITAHGDPIVQKRMAVREANRARAAQAAE